MEIVPMMGMHWIDPSSAEFNGKIFTHTMIMGSHKDKVAFFEPMFTLDFLLSKPSIEVPIKPYSQVQKTGYYYPTTYTFTYDATKKAYIILLAGLEMR